MTPHPIVHCTVCRRTSFLRALLVVALLASLLPVPLHAQGDLPAYRPNDADAAGTAATSQSLTIENEADLSQLPTSLGEAIRAALAQAPYEIVAGQDNTYIAHNRDDALRAAFDAEGVSVTSSDSEAWRLGLRLVGYGYGEQLRPLPPAEIEVEGSRIHYHRGDLVEWYRNDSRGLEQGFTLAAPPHRTAGDTSPLRLQLALDGNLTPVLANSHTLRLVDGSGAARLTYDHLAVFDAEGQNVPAHLELVSGGLHLVVDDRDATYPLLIDPLIASAVKITSGDGDSGDHFGYAVALEGNTAMVGAYWNDTGELLSNGSVYVFVRSGTTWSLRQKLTASDASSGDMFGASLALDGDTVLIGAPEDDVNSTPAGRNFGAAYVFVRNGETWSEQAKLTTPDGSSDDRFGTAVALSGNTALVGMTGDDDKGSDAGAAYVFVRSGTTWTLQQKLYAGDGAANDGFGSAVALSGDTALVAASGDDTPAGENAGSVYVFARSGTTWSEQQKLTASDGEEGDGFGRSLAFDGNTALVAASGDDTPAGENAGSVYVFARSGETWSEQQKLTASDGEEGDGFGTSVALDGNTALIGAMGNDEKGDFTGAAYVFVRSGTTWSEQAKLTASDASIYGFFGTSVALSGDIVLVGEPDDGAIAGLDAGAAYIFVRSGTTWSEQLKLHAGDGAKDDEFGWSVAIDGDTAIVGARQRGEAPAEPISGRQEGKAYVFVRSDGAWLLQQKFTVGGTNLHFGVSVALSGDTALVGASRADNDVDDRRDVGSVYVYVRSGTTWTQQQQLMASDREEGDEFGISVALDGDIALIGAHQNDEKGTDAGSAYVFVRSGETWSEQQKLTASDGEEGDGFGISVALDGDTALIGAHFDGTPAGDFSGSAYVFVRNGETWSEQQKLTPSDGAESDFFGVSVALDGDTALVGAYFADTPAGEDTGAAYVFVRSGETWSEQQKLIASDGAPADAFGVSVAVDGDIALVGAHFDDTAAGENTGAAYVFVRSGETWSEPQMLTASDSEEGDAFGISVALDGNTALIGAPIADTTADEDAGAAYAFSLDQPAIFLPRIER